MSAKIDSSSEASSPIVSIKNVKLLRSCESEKFSGSVRTG
jgi:hypothetical protein